MSGPGTSALMRFNAAYASSFEKHPTRTLVLANGTLSTIADLTAQSLNMVLSHHEDGTIPKYDPMRTARFAAFGFGMGPLIGKWLILLERAFPMPATGSQLPTVIKRVIADQVFMAPIGLTCFVGGIGLLEGKSQADIKEKFQQMYWEALKANWKVWPAIQAVNFGVVPLAYRLPFQQTCGIAWSAYLSLLNAKQDKVAEREHRMEQLPGGLPK